MLPGRPVDSSKDISVFRLTTVMADWKLIAHNVGHDIYRIRGGLVRTPGTIRLTKRSANQVK